MRSTAVGDERGDDARDRHDDLEVEVRDDRDRLAAARAMASLVTSVSMASNGVMRMLMAKIALTPP
jgi:hypothetical protein